ncbi:heterokaryon incompatibility protein-domain-containing protein [Neofusicoccum parvum]|uniref:Heterokaryon incompatibility protein-domain-containing protein n=1 Tax=Neofusicoccum parvum TaxID=310453 RepID=A0ACB5S959_9PEZI|nr:heterokaryon incompatibility protein-domain-containing protein [Neofusicoccum parvum]
MALRTRQHSGFDTALSSWDMAILEYLPLTQAREIRLIDIHPGGFSDSLRIHVYHSTLNEADSQPFDALSYVWGSPDDPVMADIDFASTEGVVCSFNLYITQNLATALRQLRYPDVPRTVWADAICINQSDYAERAQQVLMMGDIYRFARKVVAFIGPEDDDSSYAFELIQQLSKMVEVDFGSGHVKPSPGGSSEPEWADMQRDLPFHYRELTAIHHLLLREWFERLWIRQEIGIGGHRGVLRCGNNEMPWLSFCRAIFVIMRKPIIADVFDTAQYQIFRDRLGKADTVALFSMRAFRFTNLRRQIGMSLCSDERDRIYAVLGQLRETDQIGIIPDYTKTVSEVYVDATQKHIRHFNNLSILCQCELRQSRTKPALSLPSWVPDWSRPMHSSSVHGVTPPLFSILPAIESMDDKLIRAYGVRCDTVRRVVTVDDELLQNGSDASTAQMIQKLLSKVDNDGTIKGAYKSRDCILEAYCRTLWLNNFVDRWHPPVSHETPYEDCLALVRTLLDSSSGTKDPTTLPNAARCLRGARDACRGRALFVSEGGLLGLAPDLIAARDEVCALFGSYKPTALHPTGESSSKMAQQYHVVGECYLDGMMQGEPVLGKLPEDVRELLDAKALMGLRSAGFIDVRTKLILKEDPRMEPFLAGLVEKGLLHNPTLDEVERRGAMDILTKAGVPVQIFDLV